MTIQPEREIRQNTLHEEINDLGRSLEQKESEMKVVRSPDVEALKEVQLQQKVKQEEEQFQQWKANHEKQLMHVKKDSRKNEFQLNKLNALYQRRTQIKTLRNWLSQEVEKVVNVHKLRLDHEKKTPRYACDELNFNEDKIFK
nr:kinesin-like protein KIN-4A [Tanacetum cinerariifolium]